MTCAEESSNLTMNVQIKRSRASEKVKLRERSPNLHSARAHIICSEREGEGEREREREREREYHKHLI